MPRQPDDTIPLPFDELPGDKPGEGFARMVDAKKSKSELAEAKRLADEAQSGFSSSGNVRTPDAYGRDKLFMPTAEAGAPKGKQAEAAKLWQEKGTDSPFFKEWFGKSKVVDENGEPLRVYHGTKAEFQEFQRSRGGEFGSGMYFSERPDSARMFGDFQTGQTETRIIPVYLNLKNPLLTNDRNVPRGAGIKQLIKKGYDGVIGTTPNGEKQYVAFSPEQIKSATGNRGTFDAGDPNMLYMPAAKLYGPVENIGGIRLKKRQ